MSATSFDNISVIGDCELVAKDGHHAIDLWIEAGLFCLLTRRSVTLQVCDETVEITPLQIINAIHPSKPHRGGLGSGR